MNEELLAGEGSILNCHVECVKEDAQLLTEEGELITRLQTAMTQEQSYDMRQYIQHVELIAKKKIQMYSNLMKSCEEFREHFE